MKIKNKKMFIYKVILIVLIISGSFLIGIIVNKQYDDRVYDNENKQIAVEFHEQLNKQENKQINLEYNGYKVIGLIEIPAINLEYPIIDITSKATMRTSITRYAGGEVNEYGNISLAGHNNYSGTMFGRNNKLKLGDKILLTDLTGRTIEYEINKIFVTDPDDVSILDTTDYNKREVTLITCKNGRSERLIIKAEESNK